MHLFTTYKIQGVTVALCRNCKRAFPAMQRWVPVCEMAPIAA